MRSSPARSARGRAGPKRRRATDFTVSPPMVEIVLHGVAARDWVTETLSSLGATYRLVACRPADRSRKRLLRLFEVQTEGEGIAPVVARLRSRLAPRDVAVSTLGPTRALLRVSVAMPPACSVAFDLGDFCIRCPFLGKDDATSPTEWKLLVPRIDDARRLLHASGHPGAGPVLVRAGAYRSRWGLTGRQERALRTAFEIGYFDYPRKVTLSTLADRLGVGRSTALELLRKASTKLAAQWFIPEPAADIFP